MGDLTARHINDRVARIVSTGDVMLGRCLGRYLTLRGPAFPTALIDDALAVEGSIVCGNLESPLCEKATQTGAFKGHPSAVGALHRFHTLTLANNHILDCGEAGLDETLETLAAAGIAHCGVGATEDEAFAPALLEAGGLRIGFLGCVTQPLLPSLPRGRYRIAHLEHPRLRSWLREARALVDVLVLNVHAGNEYVPLPPPSLRRRLHDLCHVGVDLVVTHHPHVLGGLERVDGSSIWYSLGDFVFDGTDNARRRTGLLVATVDQHGVRDIHLQPMWLTSDLQVTSAPLDIATRIALDIRRVADALQDSRYDLKYPHRYLTALGRFELDRLLTTRREEGSPAVVNSAAARARMISPHLAKLARGRFM